MTVDSIARGMSVTALKRTSQWSLEAFNGAGAMYAKSEATQDWGTIISNAIATGEAVYIPPNPNSTDGSYPLRSAADVAHTVTDPGMIYAEMPSIDLEFHPKAALKPGIEAAALTWGANISAGGTTKYFVWCNEVNWTVAGK